MSNKLTYPTITVVSCIFLLTFSGIGMAFFTSDLAGTWHGHQIVTGDAPSDDPRWGYGSMVIDTSGNYTVNWNSPTHSNEVSNGTIQMNINGIFMIDNQPLTKGAMNNAKDQLVFVDGTSQNGGSGLVVLNKRAANSPFSIGDLEGTWYGNHVVSGDRPVDDPRWGYGTVTINSSGIYTATWTSPTQSNEVTSGTIQTDPNGMITIDNQPLSHGVMNDSKNQIVLIEGTPQTKGNALTVLTKHDSGTSFAISDMAGDWYGHQIVSGDAETDDPRWGFGTITLNSTGDYTASWNSASSSNEVTSGTIQLSSAGIITLNNQPLSHGVLNDGKDQFIITDGTTENKGNGLMIFIRFTPSGLPGAYHMLLDE